MKTAKSDDLKQARQTIDKLLVLLHGGRPADPRDCDKWTRVIVRAERLSMRLLRDEMEEGETWTNEDHAAPGEFCPECEDVHCEPGGHHEWNEEDYCNRCGADGRA